MSGTPKKASQFTPATSIADTAIIPFVYNGINYYITGANLKIAVAGNLFTSDTIHLSDSDTSSIQMPLHTSGNGAWELSFWSYSDSGRYLMQKIEFIYVSSLGSVLVNRGSMVAYPATEYDIESPNYIGGISVAFTATATHVVITFNSDGLFSIGENVYVNYSIKPIGNG